MQHEAGRQERLRDAAREDRRDAEPMRPAPDQIRRNPSTDQLKARKQLKRKTAHEDSDFPAGRPRADHTRCPYCDGHGCGHCGWTGGVYASRKTATEQDNGHLIVARYRPNRGDSVVECARPHCDFSTSSEDSPDKPLRHTTENREKIASVPCNGHATIQERQQGLPERHSERGCRYPDCAFPKNATRKMATEVPTNADKLNPGDYIRGANNQTVQVKQVRLHKTDVNQVYVDTDSGTFAVPRVQNFTRVVGPNMRQQELPASIGNPGGNSDVMPMSPGAGGMSPGSSHGDHNCPLDKTPMQLRNAGGNSVWVCPRDGYVMQAGQVPGSGGGVTSSPDLLNTMGHAKSYDHEHHEDPIGHMHQYLQLHAPEGDGEFCTRCGSPRRSTNHIEKDAMKKNAEEGTCPECSGKGNVHGHKCESCDGTGVEAWKRAQGALDEPGAGKDCPVCGGNLKGVGSNVARCEDCATEVHVQRKQEVASKTAAADGGELKCKKCDFRTDSLLDLEIHEKDNHRKTSKYAPPLESAIARRAREVLGQEVMQ